MPSIFFRELIHTAADVGKPLFDKLGNVSLVVVDVENISDEVRTLTLAQNLLCKDGWIVLVSGEPVTLVNTILLINIWISSTQQITAHWPEQ